MRNHKGKTENARQSGEKPQKPALIYTKKGEQENEQEI